MAVFTATVILGAKLILAIISFLISYGVLIAKVILCWGLAIIITFWAIKNLAAIGETFDLLAFLDVIFEEGLDCDYSAKDGQLTEERPKDINNPNNQRSLRHMGLG